MEYKLLVQKPVPENCKLYLKSIFHLFAKEFEDLEVLSKLEKEVQQKCKDNKINDKKKMALLEDIQLASSRIQYLNSMVKEEDKYCSFDNTKWLPLISPQDYFHAIQYLQLEYKRIIKTIGQEIYT